MKWNTVKEKFTDKSGQEKILQKIQESKNGNYFWSDCYKS